MKQVLPRLYRPTGALMRDEGIDCNTDADRDTGVDDRIDRCGIASGAFGNERHVGGVVADSVMAASIS